MDEDIQKVIDESDNDMQQKTKILTILVEKEKFFKTENDVVLNAAALYSGFLEQNSIITYHSAIPQYLDEQIKMEQREGNTARVAELRGMLTTYEDQVRQFKLTRAGINSGSSRSMDVLTQEDVDLEVQKLYRLELHGSHLKAWMDSVESEAQFERLEEVKRTEAAFNLPSASGGASGSSLGGRILESIKCNPRLGCPPQG